jgi:protein-tyrosine phosphatase
MEENSRILTFTGASNFRDLGGYPTTDGGMTHWGRLFRSDALHDLTENDVVLLREVGLRTIIDLRTAFEVERSGRGLLEGEPADYINLSVINEDRGESQGAPAPLDESLANRYLWYLETGREALAAALDIIGDARSYPVVFHCAAGKDRTGVLAALILDIVGVERDAIVEDYVRTATRIDAIRARLLRNAHENGVEAYANMPASALTVEAVTMEAFLDGVDERHGGTREWALGSGVSAESIETMTTQLRSVPTRSET